MNPSTRLPDNPAPRPAPRQTSFNLEYFTMDETRIQQDSPAWVTFVKVSWLAAVAALMAGIWFLPADWWIKGYLFMGTLFTISTSFAAAKTIRDQHESQKLIRKLSDLKTQKILKEYETGDL